jgi:hypothetical protein
MAASHSVANQVGGGTGGGEVCGQPGGGGLEGRRRLVALGVCNSKTAIALSTTQFGIAGVRDRGVQGGRGRTSLMALPNGTLPLQAGGAAGMNKPLCVCISAAGAAATMFNDQVYGVER